MATIIDIHAAKTHLSKIIDDVASGREVIIAKAGKPMARIVPLSGVVRPKRLCDDRVARDVGARSRQVMPIEATRARIAARARSTCSAAWLTALEIVLTESDGGIIA